MLPEKQLFSQQAPSSGEDQRSFMVSPPNINLPKGGGAIRGMGEKFAANPVTGTGSMTIPIATSPGRSGFGPQLSLSYDSGSGNGPFGFGWSLSLPAITRKTEKGLPRYEDAKESDVFILSGAEDLVPTLVRINGKWQRQPLPQRTINGKTYGIERYRPRIGGSFLGGYQVGQGINQIIEGEKALGAIDIAEGSANLGLTIGTAAALKSGALVAEAGAAAGGLALAAGVAAGASVGLAAETARAAIKGEETPIDVADKFYGMHFGDIYGWVTGAYSKR
jgi:hypothetical protein